MPKDPYQPPAHEHGTHVAGILAGDWRQDDPQGAADHDVQGVCPDMELYDLRVFDADGAGDEFAILAALQYVRWLNANASAPVIHGVNLSLSLDHEVGAYACGRTPVCDECERLLGSGTVVVAAAGNEGRAYYSMASGTAEGYRQISITDPGNADGVITVGATHRHQPHTYGVSYFSSRGPTGDGRLKPDLVAPGEKITAPVPNLGLKSLDGTSMAAPHVSGAAALLMARHPELIGSPREVKRVLCATATDLGRERYFQGSGRGRRAAGDPGGVSDGLLARGAAGASRATRCCCYAGDKLCLIDGGPGQTWATSLRPRLEQLRAARAPGGGPLRIDLAMVSHIDDDHINGPHRLRRRDGRAGRRQPAPALRGRRALAQRVRRRPRQPRERAAGRPGGRSSRASARAGCCATRRSGWGGRATSRSTGSWSRRGRCRSATRR